MAKKKTTKRKSTKRDPEIAERNKKIAIWSASALLAGTLIVGSTMGVGKLDRVAADLGRGLHAHGLAPPAPGSLNVGSNPPSYPPGAARLSVPGPGSRSGRSITPSTTGAPFFSISSQPRR